MYDTQNERQLCSALGGAVEKRLLRAGTYGESQLH
jgi:hypothetical protein